MRRIALSPEEITNLPDNYQAAVKAKTAGLPADLLNPQGAWVLVRNRTRADDFAAPIHVNATHGRAAFLILIRFPRGRKAVLDYLQELGGLPKHSEIPQIPQGTQVALMRRAMLIDNTGQLRATKLTENIQLRVYQELRNPQMLEFRLRRDALFAGRSGGLMATPRNEQSFFALSHLGFDRNARPDPIEKPHVYDERFHPPVIMHSCSVCHAGPGIFGFQSMFAGDHKSLPLAPTKLETQITPLIERTEEGYAWGLLQGLWALE